MPASLGCIRGAFPLDQIAGRCRVPDAREPELARRAPIAINDISRD